ncbi:CBS domain-containing protein [Enterococcus nangangensis]|uniref:CBS domain-containing protein n=1 Tax=Enterococcus nangangensis TaxID=2559926 RepID=UPI0010F4F58E|nr:CBS domain-containing protein [Enterococcus nangangensis]
MGKRAESFINSFNRLEKFLKEELKAPANMGFAEVVRRLSRQRNSPVAVYENDLLQMAQLRNAIVHEKIAEDFVIAEPNEWALKRMTEIQQAIMEPEKVLPRFRKHVTGFEKNIPVQDIFAKIAEKHYSQFPIYNRGQFLGLITVQGIGFWAAQECADGHLDVTKKTAQDILANPLKTPNYRFCHENTSIAEVEKWFRELQPLEAVLITKNGESDGTLLGIIRPRDLRFEH